MQALIPKLLAAALLALAATPFVAFQLAGCPSQVLPGAASIEPLPSVTLEPLLPGSLF